MEDVLYAGVFGPGQIILFLLVFFAFRIKTIVEIATSTYKDNSKTTWHVVVLLFGLIDMIIYYAAGRAKRIKPSDVNTDLLDDELSFKN